MNTHAFCGQHATPLGDKFAVGFANRADTTIEIKQAKQVDVPVLLSKRVSQSIWTVRQNRRTAPTVQSLSKSPKKADSTCFIRLPIVVRSSEIGANPW